MNGLKIIDELLCLYKIDKGYTWKQVQESSNIHAIAMKRLKIAWKAGLMDSITISLSRYFDGRE